MPGLPFDLGLPFDVVSGTLKSKGQNYPFFFKKKKYFQHRFSLPLVFLQASYHLTSVESYSVWSSVAGFFCLAYLVAGISSGVFCLLTFVFFFFFFFLNNILHFVAVSQPVHW